MNIFCFIMPISREGLECVILGPVYLLQAHTTGPATSSRSRTLQIAICVLLRPVNKNYLHKHVLTNLPQSECSLKFSAHPVTMLSTTYRA